MSLFQNRQEDANCKLSDMLDNLSEVHLGFGLIFVGNNDNLGIGPHLSHQNYNPHPIDPTLLHLMKGDAESDGLANCVADQAIQIGVQWSYIAGGLVPECKAVIYTNHIKWTDLAQSPGSEIELIDGNHHVTLMQDKFSKEVWQWNEAHQELKDATTPWARADLEKKIQRLETLLHTEGVWLVVVFDLGKQSLIDF